MRNPRRGMALVIVMICSVLMAMMMTAFVRTVLAETEDTWSGVFEAQGEKSPSPTMVLFDGQVRSACGVAAAAAGPLYCPADQKLHIYLFCDAWGKSFFHIHLHS